MKLKKVEFLTSVADLSSLPKLQLPTVVFAGRSNVGKSSLINTILNRKKIAKTSSSPGKTRFINYFIINENLYFADLPGYGYARVSKKMQIQWKSLIEPFFKINDSIRLVLILLDARRGMTDKDAQLLEFMHSFGKQEQIVLTKCDKISNSRAENLRRDICAHYSLNSEPVFFSALKKTGVSDIWTSILNNCKV